MNPLTIDPCRAYPHTGLFVRALDGDRLVNADISQLEPASLLLWLRSDGGDDPLAENVVGILLGLGRLHQVHR